MVDFGCDPGRIGEAARAVGDALGYVEVHIEQGPVLEAAGTPLGLVTVIDGASRGAVRVKSESGHDGAMPMAMRRDALAATAEMLLAIERRAAAEPHLVATVERLEVSNADVNTIPGEVSFTIDVRAPSDSSRKDALADIIAGIARIAEARGVEARTAFAYHAPTAACDASLVEELSAAVARRGYPTLRLPSGAGHDAMSFGGRIPFAMLLVRCRGGAGHNPAEYASPNDLGAATEVLVDFLEHFVPARPLNVRRED